MTIERKNDKHRTININTPWIILSLLLFFINFSCSFAAPDGKKWVIVIDPGHGGRDPGALGAHGRESDINLAIALKTGNYIEKNLENVKVIYTRKEDKTVDLYERPKIANEANADLFISIHTNKTKSTEVTGAETYIMGLTKDEENLAVAMKENEVIYLENDYTTNYQGFDPKLPESYIIFTLMQNVYLKQSTNLASKVQNQFIERLSRKDRGVKQAGFWVLFNTAMPSILIETGFISNPGEEKFLMSEQGQDYMASAIFRACRDYINEISSRSINLASVKKDTMQSVALTKPPAEVKQSLTFRIQVSSSPAKKQITPENFKGIKDISEIVSEGRFKYVTGSFPDYDEAVKYRKEITALYPDAFVIAVKDDTIMPLKEALNKIKKK
ncbi:MAG TPA: N-acetylmuramoyl-L-alanine amidase [Bacteroidales bacterium]|nr:N-acetylmuramoyl-L-alanine amidase [Bacteroidales bacterium]